MCEYVEESLGDTSSLLKPKESEIFIIQTSKCGDTLHSESSWTSEQLILKGAFLDFIPLDFSLCPLFILRPLSPCSISVKALVLGVMKKLTHSW